jgi:molecular chaperone DnaK
MPQIEVTFDIDANGIVNVSATDKGTGKEQKITIKSDGGLSQEEIDQMIKDAEANKDSDKKKRELVDSKNQADSLINSTEKSLKEHGDKVEAADKEAIETAKTELAEAAKGDDTDTIKSKIEALATAAQKLGEAVYKAQQAEAQAETKEESKKEDDIVDAEYEEVDKK